MQIYKIHYKWKNSYDYHFSEGSNVEEAFQKFLKNFRGVKATYIEGTGTEGSLNYYVKNNKFLIFDEEASY